MRVNAELAGAGFGIHVFSMRYCLFALIAICLIYGFLKAGVHKAEYFQNITAFKEAGMFLIMGFLFSFLPGWFAKAGAIFCGIMAVLTAYVFMPKAIVQYMFFMCYPLATILFIAILSLGISFFVKDKNIV